MTEFYASSKGTTLRAHLLRNWDFEQTQKSVWITEYDFTEVIKDVVAELGLEGCVELYECALLYPQK